MTATLPTPYYSHAGITLHHGDCRELLPLVTSGSTAKFDLLLTDPPYGIDADNRKAIMSREKLAAATDYGDGGWDSQPAAQADIDAAVAACKNAIVWGGNYFTMKPSPAWLVWDKLNGANDFADAELAWTNLKQAVRLFHFRWAGMLRDGEQRGVPRVHPTQKPLELMRWCLLFAPDAKTVLDPYAGSGTTLLACKLLNRRCVGIEKEERYCEIAARRLQQEVLPL